MNRKKQLSCYGSVVVLWPVTAKALAYSHARPCGICDGRSGTGIGFYFGNSGFPCRYVGGSISFRPDIQRPRQMQNALRDIQSHLL